MKKLFLLLLAAVFAMACSSPGGDADGTSGGTDSKDHTADIGNLDVPTGDDTILPDGEIPDGENTDGIDPDAVVDPDVDPDAVDLDLVDLDAFDPNDSDVDTVDPDADIDTGDQDADSDTVDPPDDDPWFKSAELGIKILGPSPTGVAQAIGASIQIAGMVVGKPDAIIWETDSGKSGYAEGMPFWLSGKVDLVQGDNIVTVTAIQGDQEAVERIIVTYNPAFRFGELTARPFALFTNTNTSVVFTQDMSLYSNFEPSTLKLCQCTQVGECVSDVKALKDDGQVSSSGDEVGQDGIFSARMSYNLDEPGKLCFRSHTVVKAGYQQFTAYSPVLCLDVVDHISQETCNEVKAKQQEYDQLYWQTVVTSDPATAQAAVVAALEADDSVAEAGVSWQGYGVWVRYENGLLGAFDFTPDGLRGSGDPDETEYGQIDAPLGLLVSSKRSMVFSPFHDELGALDEATFVHNVLDKSECPAFVLDQPYYGSKATLAQLRRMDDYGLIAITGHGDAYFKQMSDEAKSDYDWTHRQSQELVWTGEAIDCNSMVQTTPACSSPTGCPPGSECVITQASGTGTNISGICVDYKQVDLARGRAVFGTSSYGIVPSFISKHRGRGYADSLVYLGTCRSLWNGTLGMELFGAGAKAVIGYSGYVSSAFAYEQGSTFWSTHIEEELLSGESVPVPAPEDPEVPGTILRLLGATNLNSTNADLINPSWETGDRTGWQVTGDGRVISKLGITVPVEGKFMAIISTGLGYTPQVGEYFQTFCIPPDKIEMCFYWKYYSEEFKEWCGSVYQDTFEATLESDDGMVTCVDASVDDLCPPQECSGCGALYDGLIPADVIFDQGDVWMTYWRKACCNIMALAGAGSVDLRFFSTDKGDSIYDTAILIDAIKFK
jgi:hypothetical protein